MKKILKSLMAVLLLASVLVSACSWATLAAEREIIINCIPCPYPTDETKYDLHMPGGKLKLINDWSNLGYSDPGFLLFYGSEDPENQPHKIWYCIEPSSVFSSSNTVNNEADYWATTYQGKNGLGRNGLTVDVARKLYAYVLKHGYSGDFNWTLAEKESIVNKAIATQFLIWEISIGERDANFNLVDIPDEYDRISDWITYNENDNVLQGNRAVLVEYNRIAAKVQNEFRHTTDAEPVTIPSFATRYDLPIPTYEPELQNNVYTVTLTDANNVLSSYTISCNNSNVTFFRNGNKLTISVPKDETGLTEFTLYKESVVTCPGTIEIITDGNFNNSGSKNVQDLIMLSSEEDNSNVKMPIRAYFNVGFSEGGVPHQHGYAPKVVDPTCIQKGYTLWVCCCGDSYVKNYTDALGHNFGPISIKKPDCVTPGITRYMCSRCGESYVTTQSAHGHGEKVWVTTALATCTKQGLKTEFCQTCGNALDTEIINAGHGKLVWKIDAEPTADHPGIKTQYCTVCGEPAGDTEEITLHKHTAGSTETLLQPTCENPGEMGIICAICNACFDVTPIPKLGHTELVTVKTLKETCTTDGEKTSYCGRCGEPVAVTLIEAKGHTEGTWYTALKPTCTTDGREALSCSECGEAYEYKTIAKLHHDEGTWKIFIPASCTEDGMENLVCTRCDSVMDSRVVPKLGHDHGVWSVTKKATCVNTGIKTLKCTRCGFKMETQVISAEGHDDGDWLVDYEPTADHEGQMTRYCTKCNYALETKPYTNHKHREGYRETVIEPACTTAGKGGIFCAGCGAAYDTYTIPALGHTYYCWSTNNDGTHSRTCCRCHELQTHNCSYADFVVAPTCTTGGYTTHTCTVCEFTYTDAYTEPLGHCMGEWKPFESCDCCHGRTCRTCGLLESDEHNWTDWRYNKDGDIFKNGTKSRICTDCGRIETETAKHTSDTGGLLYRIGLVLGNFFNKILNFLSLNWLFPGITVKPTM